MTAEQKRLETCLWSARPSRGTYFSDPDWLRIFHNERVSVSSLAACPALQIVLPVEHQPWANTLNIKQASIFLYRICLNRADILNTSFQRLFQVIIRIANPLPNAVQNCETPRNNTSAITLPSPFLCFAMWRWLATAALLLFDLLRRTVRETGLLPRLFVLP